MDSGGKRVDPSKTYQRKRRDRPEMPRDPPSTDSSDEVEAVPVFDLPPLARLNPLPSFKPSSHSIAERMKKRRQGMATKVATSQDAPQDSASKSPAPKSSAPEATATKQSAPSQAAPSASAQAPEAREEATPVAEPTQTVQPEATSSRPPQGSTGRKFKITARKVPAPPPGRVKLMARKTVKPPPQSSSPELDTELGFQCKNQVHKGRYDLTLKRKLLPTKFLCVNTLNALGIFEDVKELLENVGLFEFVKGGVPTKRELTVEFFSSVSFEDDCLRFRLGSRDRELDVQEFRTIFNLPAPDDALASWGATPQIRDFWGLISETPYANVANAYASQIFSICFRYILRLMAYTVFMRGNYAQKVRNPENELLHAMIFKDTRSPDIALIMMKELATLGTKTSEISAGGIVTIIADYLNKEEPNSIQYPTTDVEEGRHLLDLTSLVNMGIIKKDGGRFYVHDEKADFKLYLPDPAHTKVSEQENWLPSKLMAKMGATSSSAPSCSARAAKAAKTTATAQPSSATAQPGSTPASGQTPQSCPTCGLAPMGTMQEILSLLKARAEADARNEDKFRMIEEMHKWWQEHRHHFEPPQQ